jgi:hypothetical protein
MHAVDDWGADTNDASIPLSYSRIIGRVLGLQVRELPQLLKWTSVSLDTFLHDDVVLVVRLKFRFSKMPPHSRPIHCGDSNLVAPSPHHTRRDGFFDQ